MCKEFNGILPNFHQKVDDIVDFIEMLQTVGYFKHIYTEQDANKN